MQDDSPVQLLAGVTLLLVDTFLSLTSVGLGEVVPVQVSDQASVHIEVIT